MDRELAEQIVAKYAEASRLVGPCDRPQAEAAIKALYTFHRMDEPKFQWFESPMHAVRSISAAATRRSAVRSVESYEWRQFEDACLYFGNATDNDALIMLLENRVSRWHTLVESVLSHQQSNMIEFAHGSSDAWDVCMLELENRLVHWLPLIRETVWHCGWWRPTRKVCFMVDRPIHIELDEFARIHRRLIYSDGFTVNAISGVAVPQFIAAGQYDVDDIDRMQNVEVRRVMMEDFGMERYLAESKAEEIHRDDTGVLYRKAIHNDEPLTVVRVLNSTPEPDGTYRHYFLRVPPETRTARQAVAWSFNMQPEEYKPSKET